MNSENKISPIQRVALDLLDKVKEKVLTDCSDEEIASSLVKFHPERNGFIKQDGFITADRAMKLLRIKNRNKFFALMKLHKIKNQKISNQNVGFLKEDVEMLRDKLYKK